MLHRPALVAGLLGGWALVAALVVVLSHRATRLAGVDDVNVQTILAQGGDGLRTCQAGELLPADAAAVRISLAPSPGVPTPSVRVAFEARGRTVARGALAAGWRDPFPLVTLRRAVAHDVQGRLCVELGRDGDFALDGAAESDVAPQPAASRLAGRFRAEYLRAGRESWWSLAPVVAVRMGRAHAPGGAAAVAVPAILALAALVVAAKALARAIR